MSKTIKPRSETRRGHRRASPEPAVNHGDHPITLDVTVRLRAIALPEADGGFAVVIRVLGRATSWRQHRGSPGQCRRGGGGLADVPAQTKERRGDSGNSGIKPSSRTRMGSLR